MLPDNLAISSSIQLYLDLGYDPNTAGDRAAHADHLARRRRSSPPKLEELRDRAQICVDCCRWASQRYGSSET